VVRPYAHVDEVAAGVSAPAIILARSRDTNTARWSRGASIWTTQCRTPAGLFIYPFPLAHEAARLLLDGPDSGFTAREPEQGERSAGVAGVVPLRGGDVRLASQAEGTDGEIAPGGHGARRDACPQLGSILGERHIPDMVQGLDLPVVADQARELGGVACSALRLVTA
jgi:hypothetical protein